MLGDNLSCGWPAQLIMITVTTVLWHPVSHIGNHCGFYRKQSYCEDPLLPHSYRKLICSDVFTSQSYYVMVIHVRDRRLSIASVHFLLRPIFYHHCSDLFAKSTPICRFRNQFTTLYLLSLWYNREQFQVHVYVTFLLLLDRAYMFSYKISDSLFSTFISFMLDLFIFTPRVIL